MKKLLFLFAAFTFTTAAASAQTAPVKAVHQHHAKGDKAAQTPEQRATHKSQSLTKKLGLTAPQTEQVRQLELARAKEMQSYKAQAGTTTDKAKRHEAMKAGKDRYEAQLKQILSTDQYAKYAQLRQEKMAKHKGLRKAKS